MSRFKRALHGVASSYILLAATALFSLGSVPVALHYLDPQRFGLWALMGSLIGYLTLVDAGMSGSAARLIIDHKDDPDGGRYGSLIKTGWLVSLVQAAIILVAGLALAGVFARLLAIPAALHAEFIHLVYMQCGVVALAFSTRVLAMILNAHQRMDLVNYIGTLGLLVNFAGLWLFFHFGFGVLSLAWGALCGTVVAIICQWLACAGLRLFPGPGRWGRASRADFREIFDFGKDIFLVSVGTQLIMASQPIIITRMLGLPAAGLWSVGLRVFNLASQVIWRISDMSGSALAEMMVRGETARLRERYRSLAMVSFSFAGWAAVSFALCNSLFIPLWTHGKFQWPVINDWLLAVWMIISAVVHCHNAFVILTKQIGFMRYIYFVEGMVFVTLSLLVARPGGLSAIIASSVVCSTVFSGAYGVWRIHRYFGFSFLEVALDWLKPMFQMLLFYLPVAGLIWWAFTDVSGLIRLALNLLVAVAVGSILFLRFGVPAAFQNELLGRVPVRAVPILKRLFVKAAS